MTEYINDFIRQNSDKINAELPELLSPAEFNHRVYSEMGGIDKYNEAVGIAYINAFLRQYAEMTNEY